MPKSPVRGDIGAMSAPPAGAQLMDQNSLKAFTAAHEETMDKAATVLGAKKASEAATKPAAEDLHKDLPVDVKKEYIRTLLAGEPFTNSYKLFGGAVTAVFCTRTEKTNAKIRLMAHGDAARHVTFCMLHSLRNLSCSTGSELAQPDEVTVNWLEDLQDIEYSAVCKAFEQFEELCDTLYRRANDPNF